MYHQNKIKEVSASILVVESPYSLQQHTVERKGEKAKGKADILKPNHFLVQNKFIYLQDEHDNKTTREK